MIENTYTATEEEDLAEHLLKDIIAGPRSTNDRIIERDEIHGPVHGLINALTEAFPGASIQREQEELAAKAKADKERPTWYIIDAFGTYGGINDDQQRSEEFKKIQKRKEILDRLGRLWNLHPEMTLGKLLLSAVDPFALYSLGDAPLLSALEVCLALDDTMHS